MQRMIIITFVLFSLGFFTVASAQLPPEIRADAYLLQGEQAIRNGDLHRAQAAIQNILRLQKEHELDLSDEFYFRYAKAADAVDLSDQALESVLKYLVASGREGQHYLEALALMDKVQMAVICKGWDTEEYFKTATLEEVNACLDTGVDLNERDDAGATPLHRAVYNANPDIVIVQVLLNAGADPNVRTKSNRIPLHFAAFKKNADFVKVLLNAGADPNRRDLWGATPLHYAAERNGNPDVIKALLNAGADPNVQNKKGFTPLGLAIEKNKNPDVAMVLRAAGATQTKIAGKSQEGDGFGKAAAALLGGAAIMYAGKDATD